MTVARTILAILACGAIALVGGGCGDAVNDAYAKWGVGEMVVAYLDDHDDAWPRAWEDLKPYFARNNARVPGWSFEKLQQRIVIDFKVDTRALMMKAAAAPDNSTPFIVVRASHVLSMTWSHEDPNVRIARYLKGQARAKQINAAASQPAR